MVPGCFGALVRLDQPEVQHSVTLRVQSCKDLVRCFEVKHFARSVVEPLGDLIELVVYRPVPVGFALGLR